MDINITAFTLQDIDPAIQEWQTWRNAVNRVNYTQGYSNCTVATHLSRTAESDTTFPLLLLRKLTTFSTSAAGLAPSLWACPGMLAKARQSVSISP